MTSSYQEARQRGASRCGIGLGLRWDFLTDVLEGSPLDVSFFEISPENYMRRGGYFPQALEQLCERYQFVTHGLTMSVGAVDLASDAYFAGVKEEIARVAAPWHSDHLCLSTAGPLILHDLLPMAMTRTTAQRAADRIRQVEDKLGVPFAVENISFYAHPVAPEMSELDFLCEVLRLSDAGFLLDVNNVYVNAKNHGYDAREFIKNLPHEQVIQLHIAGHKEIMPPHPAAGMLLDTHGAPVVDPVKSLLADTLECVGPVPVLLERDNEIPPLDELMREVDELRKIYTDTLGETES